MRNLFLIPLLMGFMLRSADLKAESFFTLGAGMSNFSFQSREKAKTPNISGLLAELGFGYSAGNVFDLGIRSDYMYGSAGATELAKKEITLLNYGGFLGFRIAKTVNLQFLYLLSQYDYFESEEDDMINHSLKGEGMGISFGLMTLYEKEKAVQVMLSFRQIPVTGKNELGETVDNTLVQAVFSLSVVFASFHKVFTESKLFKGLI